MKRHPFDLTSFIFGAVFGGAAIVYLLADQLAWDIDGRWILPLALITLGIAGIAGAVTGLRSGSGDAEMDESEDGEPKHASVS
ncbi:MAG: hypothetical protein LH645_03520 [Actinomycetia bacterium]|nr:hypothetical protein [Actinomycetes bacterium]